MSEGSEEKSASLVAEILKSRKYRQICPDTVHSIVGQEMARQQNPKIAERIARERLHRLWAQFLGEPNYNASIKDLNKAFDSDSAELVESTCLAVLKSHASTHERVPELSHVYLEIFKRTGVPGKLADLACAFGPFAFRWMGLPRNIEYYALDINERIVEIVNHYFRLEGIQPNAALHDVLCSPLRTPVDVALLLKMYHCLEHRERGAGWRVIEQVPARWIAVSFPTRNLRGRRVDIIGNYESTIVGNATNQGWSHAKFECSTEAFLLIEKGDIDAQ